MILTNGDSWTGGRLKSPEKVIYWPDYLSEMLSQPVTNIAFGGSSNQRIFRTTLDAIYSNDDITDLIVGWSTPDRYEIPSMVNNVYNMISPQIVWSPNLSDKDKDRLQQFYYQWCYSEYNSVKTLIEYVLALDDICSHRGIRLLNFQSFHDVRPFIETHSDLSQLAAHVDTKHWMPETMSEATKQFARLASGHTNDVGNKYWAELVYLKLTSN
jgi:hypothetical protein